MFSQRIATCLIGTPYGKNYRAVVKKNIIHMANGSDEDDTVDGDDIFIIFSIFSKTGKSFEGGRIQCICHEIRSSSLASRDSQLRRVCGLTIRFKM